MSSTGQKIWEFIKKQGKVLAGHFCYDPFWPKIKSFLTGPRWKKARLIVGIFLVAILCLAIFLPATSNAGFWAWVGGGVATAVGSFLMAIVVALSTILKLVGIAFQAVILNSPFDKVISNYAVGVGWKATRDVCNLAFVLILLGIGFATILRVPAYHIKKLIVPFIVALLLINFSKLICGVITDFCHIVMVSFAAAMTGGNNYSGAIAQALHLSDWFNGPDANIATQSDKWKWVEGLIILIIFLIALTFAFLLIVVLLISRWITLMVLTIFSPLVYAAQILPTTKGFAKKWWQQFLQNAFYGPVAVFMVYLAILIVSKSTNLPQGTGGTDFSGINADTFIGLLIACILLYKAVTMSRSMGIAGASAVINTGTKWGKGALGAVGAGVGMAAGWAGSRAWDRWKRSAPGGAVSKGVSATREKLAWSRLGKAGLDQKRGKAEKAAAENLSMAGAKDDALAGMASKGSVAQRTSALAELAKRGKSKEIEKAFGSWGAASKFMDQYGSGQAAATFKDAWKKADPYKASTGTPQEREDKTKRHLQSKGVKDIDAASFTDPNMARLTAASVSTSAIRDMTDEQKQAFQGGLAKVNTAGMGAKDRAAINRARAVAHGNLSAVASGEREETLKSMSVEDVAGMSMADIDGDATQKKALGEYFLENPASLAGVQRKNPEMTQAYVSELTAGQAGAQQRVQQSPAHQAIATIEQQAQQAAETRFNHQMRQLETDHQAAIRAGNAVDAGLKQREMDRLNSTGPTVQYSAKQQNDLATHRTALAPLERELKKYDKVLSNPMLGATGP